MASRLGSFGAEDRGPAMLVYGLYLFGLVNGLTILIGVCVAVMNLRGSGPMLHSHSLLQIRTVWIALFWFLLGGGLIFAGVAIVPGGLGAPLQLVGWLISGSTWLWFAARSLFGLSYLLRRQPYPRPRSWLI